MIKIELSSIFKLYEDLHILRRFLEISRPTLSKSRVNQCLVIMNRQAMSSCFLKSSYFTSLCLEALFSGRSDLIAPILSHVRCGGDAAIRVLMADNKKLLSPLVGS